MGDTCAGSGGIDEEKRGKHDEGGRKTHDDGWDEGGGGGGLEDVVDDEGKLLSTARLYRGSHRLPGPRQDNAKTFCRPVDSGAALLL